MTSVESNLVYSTDVARRAGRFFCWHRFLTNFGFLYLVALLATVAMLVLTYELMGTNWFFGFWVTILGMNVILLVAFFHGLPRALASSVSELESPCGHVVVDGE